MGRTYYQRLRGVLVPVPPVGTVVRITVSSPLANAGDLARVVAVRTDPDYEFVYELEFADGTGGPWTRDGFEPVDLDTTNGVEKFLAE